MLKSALKTLLGDQHKREAKKLQPLVDEINEIYAGLSSLSDDELKAKTDEFRAYIEEKTSDLKREIEELRDEIRFQQQQPSEKRELDVAQEAMAAALKAFDDYLKLAPPDQLATARKALDLE